MNHFYKSIPGWFSFRRIYEEAVREAPDGAKFVEVGCWKGRSAAFLAVEIIKSGKDIRLACVDTWLGSNEPKHLADPSVKDSRLFLDFLLNIRPVSARIEVIRDRSVSAARRFAEESVDFVFIDAAHDFCSVTADIAAWWPTIKPGGVLAGDDYGGKAVRKAVNEFGFESVEEVKGTGTGSQWRVRKC